MSTYEDRRQARRYEVGAADLEFPLVFTPNGKVGIARDPKSALSVNPLGLTFNFDAEFLALKAGSPWQLTAKRSATGATGATGPAGADGADGTDGVAGSIVVSELIIASVASNPLVFADIVQNSGGTDFVYSS